MLKMIMYLGVIAIFIIALLMLPGTLGLEYRYYCLDAETLQKEAAVNSNVSGSDQTYIVNQSITCEYGCDSQSKACQPPPYQQTLMTASIIITLLIIGTIFWRWFSR